MEKIPVYFAPMEGITGYPFRNAYEECFPGIDGYYTPFISANETFSFSTREVRDTARENNRVPMLVPQVMTNQGECFAWAVEKMAELGYTEVDLNAGCPSGTVVQKDKGAGMLRYTYRLDSFFEEAFDALEKRGLRGIRISVKTRLGLEQAEEMNSLLPVFDRYPIDKLILHPRVRREMYNGRPNLEAFAQCYQNAAHPVVYNGDITSPEDYERIVKMFPQLSGVMIGRGLLMRPSLVREIRGGDGMTKGELRAFLEKLICNYRGEFENDHNMLVKLKEYWSWLGQSFSGAERYVKEIRKSADMLHYQAAVRNLFANCEIRENKNDH